MFEKIVLRNSDAGGPISAGQLAEALLFYRSVHLVLDEQSVANLVKTLGVGAFVDVLKRPDLSSTFVCGMPVAISVPVGPMTAHAFGFVAALKQKSQGSSVVNSQSKSKFKDQTVRPFDALVANLGALGVGDADAKMAMLALRNRAPARDLGEKDFSSELISKLATDDLADQDFLRRAVINILRASLPAEVIPDAFKLRVQDSDLGFYVLGSLNFVELEALRKVRFPEAQPVEVGHVLLSIFQARVDLTLASHYGGDFATSPLSSELIRLRFDMMLERKRLHDRQIDDFHSIVLEDAPTLAESIDSGERSFSEFLRLLDKSAKFKEWAGGVHPDKGLPTPSV
jgi:hypothetical protein